MVNPVYVVFKVRSCLLYCLLTTLLATEVKNPSTYMASSGPASSPEQVAPIWSTPSKFEAPTAMPSVMTPMKVAIPRDTRTWPASDMPAK